MLGLLKNNGSLWTNQKNKIKTYAEIEKLQEENKIMREALTKLRDCDWIISLPDRMDAIRKIEGEALENTK